MPSYDELVAACADIQKILDDGAEARLRALPGVTHVSVGAKERGGRPTRELCIRVYVSEKRPLPDVPTAARIPSEVDGVPTDVNTIGPFRPLQENMEKYRPVKGGIRITNRIISTNSKGKAAMGVGTLGCIATLTATGKPMLLSNHHVLMAHSGRKDDYIFQPGPYDIPAGTPPPPAPIRPGKASGMIAKIVTSVLSNKVDAAIAELDVSSCCHCCGIDYRNEIVGLSKDGEPPSNTILGMRRAVPTKKVYKVGIMTGRTEGMIVSLSLPLPDFPFDEGPHSFVDQMEIAHITGDEPFAWPGDSGSVIIDEDGYIVGLLFGAQATMSASQRSYANHIVDVCAALKITINLDRTTHHNAGARVAVPRATFDNMPTEADAELYAVARARLLGTPAGASLWALAEAHREEIVSLVTRHRPVTVTWHRAGGPAMFATSLNALRAGEDSLPVPPNGATLDEALARLGDALVAHGSPALRDAIAAHRADLLAAVRDSVTLDDVLGKLSR